MTWRSTGVLSAIAIVLFAYISLVERHRVADGELEGRDARLVERFVRSRISRVEIDGGDRPIVLERDENDDGSINEWRLLAPIEDLADETAVGSLLGSLEWSDARRSFAAEPSEAAAFGLDSPRRTLRIRMGGEGAEVVEIRFGNDVENGGGVYLTADRGRTIKVAGQDVWEAADHDVEYFRSKRLLRRGVLTAERLEIVFRGVTSTLSRSDQNWMIGGIFARTSEVDEALQAVSDLEAASFAESTDEIDDTRLSVEAVRPRAGDEPGEGSYTLSLTAGPSEGCGTGYWLVQMTADGHHIPKACVAARTLEPLRRSEWRDHRVMRASTSDVRSIRIEGEGEPLVVARGDDDTWSGTVSADADAVREWLADLRRLRVASFEASCDGESGVRLLLEPGTHALSIADEASARRSVNEIDEDACITIEGGLSSLLSSFRHRIRPRQLLDASSVTNVEIVRDGITERIEGSEDDGWRVVEPVEADADATAVAALLISLRTLRAARFPAEDQSPSLENAVTLRFTAHNEEGETTSHILEVGESRDGEAPARLDGDAIFMVSDSFSRAVRSPLVSRTLAAVPAYEITALTVAREGRETTFRIREGLFVDERDEPVDPERMDTAIQAIARLRLRPTMYGPGTAREGLDAPRIELRIQSDGETRLAIGAEAAEGGVFVRAGGGVGVAPATFVETIEALPLP